MAKRIVLTFRQPAGAAHPAGSPRPQRWREAGQRRRRHVEGAVAGSAARLLPLVALLEALALPPSQESVFRTRRKLLRAHWDAAYAGLRTAHPRHRRLAPALHALAELLRDEARDISPEQWRRAARELTLATLRNAPGLLSAAHQVGLLA